MTSEDEPVFNFYGSSSSEGKQKGRSDLHDRPFLHSNIGDTDYRMDSSFFFADDSGNDCHQNQFVAPASKRKLIDSRCDGNGDAKRSLRKLNNANDENFHESHPQFDKRTELATLTAEINQPLITKNKPVAVPTPGFTLNPQRKESALLDEAAKFSEASAPVRTYAHPIQLRNELSPTPLNDAEMSICEGQAEIKQAVAKSRIESGYCRTENILGSVSINENFSNQDSNSSHHGNGEETKHSCPSAESSKSLTDALMSSKYETLKEQLCNLPAAKSSGDFVYQVALSISALFKCSEMTKDETEKMLSDHKEAALSKVDVLRNLLNTQIEESNRHHKISVDGKLSKLSPVLDEIKSNQEELVKYRNLLRSFSSSSTADNSNGL